MGVMGPHRALCVPLPSLAQRGPVKTDVILLPGAGTNHMRGEGTCLEQEPTTIGERVYTWGGNQSHEGRGYIPGVGTNHMREEGIYLGWEPIA